jgi:hypothetical protein
MSAPKTSNTWIEVIYRVLCLPYFLLLGAYCAAYLYAPYFSYAAWNADAFFVAAEASKQQKISTILGSGTLGILALWLVILRSISIAYSWALLSPLRERLGIATHGILGKRLIAEFSMLALFLTLPFIIIHFRHSTPENTHSEKGKTDAPLTRNQEFESSKRVFSDEEYRDLIFTDDAAIALQEIYRLQNQLNESIKSTSSNFIKAASEGGEGLVENRDKFARSISLYDDIASRLNTLPDVLESSIPEVIPQPENGFDSSRYRDLRRKWIDKQIDSYNKTRKQMEWFEENLIPFLQQAVIMHDFLLNSPFTIVKNEFAFPEPDNQERYSELALEFYALAKRAQSIPKDLEDVPKE